MGLINRAFRDYERMSFGKLKGVERERARGGFHAGILVAIEMLFDAGSGVELEIILRELRRELLEFGDSLPCTCGQCRAGGRGSHAGGHGK